MASNLPRLFPLLTPGFFLLSVASERPLVRLQVRGHNHVHSLPEHPSDGVRRGSDLGADLVEQSDEGARVRVVRWCSALTRWNKKVIDNIIWRCHGYGRCGSLEACWWWLWLLLLWWLWLCSLELWWYCWLLWLLLLWLLYLYLLYRLGPKLKNGWCWRWRNKSRGSPLGDNPGSSLPHNRSRRWWHCGSRCHHWIRLETTIVITSFIIIISEPIAEDSHRGNRTIVSAAIATNLIKLKPPEVLLEAAMVLAGWVPALAQRQILVRIAVVECGDDLQGVLLLGNRTATTLGAQRFG